jgi:uncharacterized protein YlxW (UPF0749 family)
MAAFVRFLAVGVVVAAVTLVATGCSGTAAAKDGSQVRSVRLMEEENARLGDQIKGLEKQIEKMKDQAAVALKEKANQEKAVEDTLGLLMDQVGEKDKENKKLQEKVAELEKELAGLKAK